MIDSYETAVLKQLTNAQLVFDAMNIETSLENDFDHDIGSRRDGRTASLSFTFPQSVRGDSNLSVSVSHNSEHMGVRVHGKVSEQIGGERQHETDFIARLIRGAIQSALLQYYRAIESSVLGRAIRA
jgi:hypothetical protein